MSGRAMTSTATVIAWAPQVSGVSSTVLERCIDAASEMIEYACGRHFLAATYSSISHNGSLTCGDAYSLIYLENPDTGLATPNVSTISTLTEDGTSLTVALMPGGTLSASVGALGYKRTGQVVRVDSGANSATPKAWTSGLANILVTYQAGFALASMPDDIEHACVELTWLLYRESLRTGQSAANIDGLSSSFRGMLSPMAQSALDNWTIPHRQRTISG